MKARINAPLGYKCSPCGKFVQNFPEGMIVEGQIAEWAVKDGAAVKIHDPREETKIDGPTETKAPRKRGRPRKSDQ